MNPADVMNLPVGLLGAMDHTIKEESRQRRLEARRAKARAGRGRRH